MITSGRTAVATDASRASWRGMSELLRGDLEVMRLAQVARVSILVAAAQCQRLDVVDDSSNDRQVLCQAHLAKAVRSLQTTKALGLACAASQPFNDGQSSYLRPDRYDDGR